MRISTCFCLLALVGCSPEVAWVPREIQPDAGPTPSEPLPPDSVPHVCGYDADGDGIADVTEGSTDLDGDGVSNDLDLDSDGDSIADHDEWAGSSPCDFQDSDLDGKSDPYDLDSDSDGLPDAQEAELGTNVVVVDSDGDGVSDLGEVEGSGTDPLDPESTIDSEDFFVVLPFGAEESRVLQFQTKIVKGDVFLLVDTTGSMRGERDNLIAGLLDVIVPGVTAAIPNVQLGIGGHDDYPVFPHGSTWDLPVYLMHPIVDPMQDQTTLVRGPLQLTAPSCEYPGPNDRGVIVPGPNGISDLWESITALPCHNGTDEPESQIAALFSIATGQPIVWPSGEYQGVPYAGGETEGATCPSGHVGLPCFRPGALPIVMMVGDQPFRGGPSGLDLTFPIGEPYTFTTPTYEETVVALNQIGARVLSIFSGHVPEARADYEAISLATGAVDAEGNPLSFTIATDGTGLSEAIVEAIAELVGATPQDVDALTENVEGNPDGIDARTLISSVTPHFDPQAEHSGFEGADATTFLQVIPGTDVEFEVAFRNDSIPPQESARIFRAEIVVRGNHVTELDRRSVYIVVPPDHDQVVI